MAEKKKSIPSDNFHSTGNLTTNLGFHSEISIISKEPIDEKSYNPFEHRNVEHPNSTLGSILHLLKACLGTGLLAMPSAFKNAGLVAGAIGVIIAGVICTYTVYIFVDISQHLCVEAKIPSMGFAETCGAVFTYGPKKLQRYAKSVRVLVDYSMLLAYISTLCVYVVFIGSTFKEVMDYYVPGLELSVRVYCALVLVPAVLLCQIRNLKYLVPFSLVANLMMLCVFAITLYYIFTDLPSFDDRALVAPVSQWPLFLSTVVFAMEGVGVVMPIENEMKKPSKFLGCPGVWNTSMCIIIGLYGVIGFFGYVQYGEGAKGSITLNLPEDSIMAQTAKGLMALVIFFSYALQFYVPMEYINRVLAERGPLKYPNFAQVSIRTAIVTLSVVVAVAFPNLELVISLVGAIFFSSLGLLFPAITDIIYRWERRTKTFYLHITRDIIIAIISLIALVSGSYVSISGLIKQFGSGTTVSN